MKAVTTRVCVVNESSWGLGFYAGVKGARAEVL